MRYAMRAIDIRAGVGLKEECTGIRECINEDRALYSFNGEKSRKTKYLFDSYNK